MAAYSANFDESDALTVGDIHHAHLLLAELAPPDCQNVAQIVISNEQCEALKFLIREYKLDVDKYYCLHLALLSGQENIAKLLVGSGADVNKCWRVKSEKDIGIALQKYVDMLRKIYPGSCEKTLFRFGTSMNCSIDIIRFLLQSGTAVDKSSEIRRYGHCALHMAVNTRGVEKIKLNHGADTETGSRPNKYETPLTSACGNPTVSADCVQVLLEKGANPNSRTGYAGYGLKFSKGAIHLAVESRNTETVQLLIQHGAQLESRTSEGDTALILACKESIPADIVRILLENGAFPNVKNRKLQMPLTLATATNYEENTRLLKQYGAVEEEKTDQEETALMSACQRNGDVETVRHLLENNASSNLRNRRGETALHYAVLPGNTQNLQVLLQYNSDVNAMDDNGVTPLMKACKELFVSVECVTLLLENNALPNLTNNTGTTAVHYAARTSNRHKMTLLLQYGADVNALTKDRDTPLMLACAKNSVTVACVRFLLYNNALVNVKNVFGLTALDYAIRRKNLQKVKLLIEYNADVNAMMDDGKAGLMKACFSDDVDRNCVKYLIENSALISLTVRGYTCLHWAIRYHRKFRDSTAVQWLIGKGMSLNQRDEGGWTPLMAAVEGGHTEIVKLLIEAGADVHAIRTLGGDSSMDGTTALSLAFGNTMSKYSCAELLIKAGAVNSLSRKHNNLLHSMVNLNKCKMINLLLTHGMGPTLCRMPYSVAETTIPVSPLTLALMCGVFPVIRYLTGNMVLCPCDVNGHLYHKKCRGRLNRSKRTDILSFMDEFYSQPKSLFQLCCVTISYTVDGVPGRLDRINSLPIPEPLKKQLLFKNSYVPEGCINDSSESEDADQDSFEESNCASSGFYVGYSYNRLSPDSPDQ